MMRRCVKCILPETFPGITFDDEGVCSVCRDNHRQAMRHVPSEVLYDKFIHILEECRACSGHYDALVAYSGGKDSTYLLKLLKEQYHLKILAFTFDNGFMAGSAFENMKRVLGHINVDHLILKADSEMMSKVFLCSSEEDIYPSHLIKYGSGICISCIRIVNNMALRTAIEKNIPMVFIGNSPGQLIQSDREIIYQDNRIPYSLRKKLFEPLAERVGEEIYHYFVLEESAYKQESFPFTINLFPIIGYDESAILKEIIKIGWVKPADVDPNSTNCQLNSLGIIKHKDLYRFSPYDYEMSMLVRLGRLDRAEALQRVEDPHGKAISIAAGVQERLSKVIADHSGRE